MIPNTMFRPTVVTMMKKVRSKRVRGMYKPKFAIRSAFASLKIPSPFYIETCRNSKYMHMNVQLNKYCNVTNVTTPQLSKVGI